MVQDLYYADVTPSHCAIYTMIQDSDPPRRKNTLNISWQFTHSILMAEQEDSIVVRCGMWWWSLIWCNSGNRWTIWVNPCQGLVGKGEEEPGRYEYWSEFWGKCIRRRLKASHIWGFTTKRSNITQLQKEWREVRDKNCIVTKISGRIMDNNPHCC